MAFVSELGNLIGTQSMPIDSTLIFRHQSIDSPLFIRSGANSIKWSYQLNTTSTPTIGGEVVQILSCFVGPITIEGMTAGMQTGENIDRSLSKGWAEGSFTPVDEMTHIIQWFLTYMHRAGTLHRDQQKRNEAAIHFLYPARGWDFFIQVIDVQGFEVAKDQVAIPWSITAEIVSDPALDYFVSSTMNTYTDSLTSRRVLQEAVSPDLAFNVNPFVNPHYSKDKNAVVDIASRLGDNFQALVASWIGGEFPAYGFSGLADPVAQTGVDNPYSIYNLPDIFGGEYLGSEPQSDYGSAYAGTGGATVGGSQTVPAGSGGDGVSYMGDNLINYITCKARSLGLDPGAVLAVADVEGDFYGAVGDSGTSFGPFQMHGGATVNSSQTEGTLPQSIWERGPDYAKFWANTALGLDHALSGIARVAAGLTGTAAITKIVYEFERPANKPQEVANASAVYDKWSRRAATVDCSAPVRAASISGTLSSVVAGRPELSAYRLSHPTDGVPNSYAVDIVASPNTPVYAPEDMEVTANDPTGAQGGGRARAIGKETGLSYWFGHITGGRTGFFRRGEQFSTISSDHKTPHIHVGIDSVAALGHVMKSGNNYESDAELAAAGIPTIGAQLNGS